MSTDVKVGLKTFLLVLGSVGVVGLVYLLWPYWELLLVIGAVTLYCFAAYQSGKMRRS